MTDQDIRELSRLQVLYQLYYLRRYAYAKLVYESVLHGGSPSLWKGIYDRPTSDPMTVYRELFSTRLRRCRWTRPTRSASAPTWTTRSTRPTTRASFALAHLIHEGMRAKFGPDWYGSPEAGRLIQIIWSPRGTSRRPRTWRRCSASPSTFARPRRAFAG